MTNRIGPKMHEAVSKHSILIGNVYRVGTQDMIAVARRGSEVVLAAHVEPGVVQPRETRSAEYVRGLARLARMRVSRREGGGYHVAPKARDDARHALRRDWAVRVLDAYDPSWRTLRFGSYWLVEAQSRHLPDHTVTDRDAARHAAAKAVFPTLPDAVRAALGECP